MTTQQRTLHGALTVPARLEPFVNTGLVDVQHVRAVSLLAAMAGLECEQLSPLGHVALALVLDAPQSGHTCIDFTSIRRWGPDDADDEHDEDDAAGENKADSATNVDWPHDASEWLNALGDWSSLVATPDERNHLPRKPFVLDGHLLYASRSFDEEARIADYLAQHAGASVRIITGGPGSGKTTQVANILVQRIVDHHRNAGETRPLNIALAAPTGLAAKRMAKAIRAAVHSPVVPRDVELSADQLALIDAVPTRTVHKLLGYRPQARVQYRHNADNPLPYDVVIIDEVSMLPLSMMSRVIDALRPPSDSHPGAELLLVGDANQLASVEAGTVLADIVEGLAPRGEAAVRHLTENHRFGADSPVGALSIAINEGDVDEVNRILDTTYPSGENDKRFVYVDSTIDSPHGAAQVNDVARAVVHHARTLCEMSSQPRTTEQLRELLRHRESLQVVTAHRGGQFGVSGWNASVERRLGALANGPWYLGRPVMVTRNDTINDLSNGDIGVVCLDDKGNRVVAFGDENDVRTLPVAKIPHVETVHALTIHKSQGSEYAHTIVVLPQRASRIVTRELLYTGITRAKPHLTLIAPRKVVELAVRTRIQRATGLARRLLSPNS